MFSLMRSAFRLSSLSTLQSINRCYSSLSSRQTLKFLWAIDRTAGFKSVRYQSQINENKCIENKFASFSPDDQIKLNEEKIHRDQGSFDKFHLHSDRQKCLKARGIEYLFPVQYHSFKDIENGKDCIVQAHTGTGKTLAFTLPILQRLEDDSKGHLNKRLGRYPRCLVLEPTRELAQQITSDFLSIKSRSTAITTIYGGKKYFDQENSLRHGSDIVVGTPGRIKDFLNQKKLFLHQCEILVLDEVDRMLDMGFQDDVDFIVKHVSNHQQKSQMIVFSATIPNWLKTSVSRYMCKENFSYINLIDQSQKKTAANIEHFSVKIKSGIRLDRLILSLFEEHSMNLDQSQMIIFCQTKAECDRLIQSNQINSYASAVLHGDLSQNRREQVLDNFRKGLIRFLITTDISARGLDIPQVDLIVLTSPPQDWESYVHRSGRTGRAGKKGKSICIYQPQQLKQLSVIHSNTNIEFKPIDYNSLRSFSQND